MRALLLLGLAACSGPVAEPVVAQAPAYSVAVQDWTCNASGGWVRAAITLSNTGPAIPFAKVFVTIGGEHADDYFSPASIPAGAMASAEIRRRSEAKKCQLAAIQDGNGNPVAFTLP